MRTIFLSICLLFGMMATAIAQQPALQEGLALKYLVQLPVEKQEHAPVIILLHGYGSNERDMFELKSIFPENYVIIAARAPNALPGSGYQWYDITSTNGRHDGKPDQLASSRDKVIKFIAQVIDKYKIDAKQVYVMGFSQGAVMSYEVGLSSPDKVKGIGVLSGKIPPSLRTSIKNTPDLKKLKIFISHGTADERISFADCKESVDYLKSIGLTPSFHQYEGMGHTVSEDVMKDLLNWLK